MRAFRFVAHAPWIVSAALTSLLLSMRRAQRNATNATMDCSSGIVVPSHLPSIIGTHPIVETHSLASEKLSFVASSLEISNVASASLIASRGRIEGW